MSDKKLKIGLIGYGKMGKTIEKLAIKKGHEVILRISSSNVLELNAKNLNALDVAIEFTSPQSAAKNLEILAQNKVPTVCGSTAWLSEYRRISKLFSENETPFLYASNFSVGVNVMFAVNKYLAKLMDNLSEYDISMTESHHIEKKDAPSGTGVTLAEQIIDNVERKIDWHQEENFIEDKIKISSIREKDVKGIHEVKYVSQIDEISLRHEAYSREGFAKGALMAAEFIVGKKGIFSMNDLLNI
jgi:4-hydroxy-tetrahydrodipicolinate reductase